MPVERTIESPVGFLTICADEGGICALYFGNAGKNDPSHLLDGAAQELEEYFAGRRRLFSVPLSINGTPFRERVWRELTRIPWGETISYGELARRIGNPRASRAVGMANHHNPLPIFIPCHRVVGANGKLTGYAGGLEIKKKLLEIEGIHAEI